MAKNGLGAHARDELGISEGISAKPTQAALNSAATFAAGAALPILAESWAPHTILVPAVFGASLIVLALLGPLGRRPVARRSSKVLSASRSGERSPWLSQP
jgi:VIT1/CCC1 family predicted Fe2+/Mn2+ transporter